MEIEVLNEKFEKMNERLRNSSAKLANPASLAPKIERDEDIDSLVAIFNNNYAECAEAYKYLDELRGKYRVLEDKYLDIISTRTKELKEMETPQSEGDSELDIVYASKKDIEKTMDFYLKFKEFIPIWKAIKVDCNRDVNYKEEVDDDLNNLSLSIQSFILSLLRNENVARDYPSIIKEASACGKLFELYVTGSDYKEIKEALCNFEDRLMAKFIEIYKGEKDVEK